MHRTIGSDVTHALVEVLHEVGRDHPCAIGVAAKGRQIELSLRPLAGVEPLIELIGFEAPAHWSAFAVAAPCRLTDLRVAGDAHDSAAVVHLRTREGLPLTTVASDTVTTTDAEPEGRLADVCRRVLGQPTAPPPNDTAVLAAGLWLDRLLDTLLGRDLDDPPLTWAQCRALLTAEPLTSTQLQHFGRAFADRWPWAIVRRTEATDSVLGLPPNAAEWLDDGSFARWVLAELAPVGEIRADVVELLGPEVGGRVDSTLDHWLAPVHR